MSDDARLESKQRVSEAVGEGFRVEELIGSGGQAEVWRAQDLSLGRTVAIKILRPEVQLDRDLVERLRGEATALARISSPHVVPIFQLGNRKGTIFLIMPFVSERTVATLIRWHGALAGVTVRQILIDVAIGLDAAHVAGVVHRDVKPSNILIQDGTGRALLADFGISRALDPSAARFTATGALVGSPEYMSPEQFSDAAAIGPASDIYSLGVVGFEMLTGKLPHKGPTLFQLAFQHNTETPESLDLVHGVSEPLARTIERCMAKDPHNRPSASVLIESLVAQRRPVEPSRDEAVPVPAQSQLVRVAKFIVLLVATGILAVLTIMFRRELRPILGELLEVLIKIAKVL